MGGKEKGGKQGCPDSTSLVAAFAGDLETGRAAGILAHAETCPRCRVKHEILLRLRPELEARRDLVPEKLSRKELRAWRLLTAQRTGDPRLSPAASRRLGPAWIAATVLFLAAVGYLGVNRLGRMDVMRGDASSGLKIVKPIGLISEAPVFFVWESLPGADYYEITIASEAYETVFRGSSSSPAPFRLDEDIRKNLKPGIAYLWTVVAKDDLSRRIGSGRGVFEIR